MSPFVGLVWLVAGLALGGGSFEGNEQGSAAALFAWLIPAGWSLAVFLAARRVGTSRGVAVVASGLAVVAAVVLLVFALSLS